MPRTTCEIQIYEPIGGWDMSASRVAEMLKGEGDRVEVLINSPGGEIMEGLGIFNMLRAEAKKRTVRCTVMGAAASMASVIAMAGDEVCIWDNAFLMLHNPQGWADVLILGESKDMRDAAADLLKEADVLDFLKARLVGAYSRGGKATADWPAVMDNETWIDAPTALSMGLVDKIIPAPKDPATARWRTNALDRFPRMPPPLRARLAQVPAAPNPAPPISQQETRRMTFDTQRAARALMAASDLLATAQEGAASTDKTEADAYKALAGALPPFVASIQALGDAAPQASIGDLLALRDTVARLTGQTTGLSGAVEALAANSAKASQVGERAQVREMVALGVTEGKIPAAQREAYEARSLADVRAFLALAIGDPPRLEPIAGAGQIGDTPNDDIRAAARKRAASLLGEEK